MVAGLRRRPVAGSAAQHAIEADAGDDPERHRGCAKVDQLTAGIEESHEDERDDAAADAGDDGLSRAEARPARAPVRFGEMPSTAWTGGHAGGVSPQ